MSAMVRAPHGATPPRALVFVPGQGVVQGVVQVYRDGEAVVVIGSGGFVKQTPFGLVESTGDFQVRFPTIDAFDWAKSRALEKSPVAYARAVGLFGVDDDATNAPELPTHVERRTLPALVSVFERRTAALTQATVQVSGVNSDDADDAADETDNAWPDGLLVPAAKVA